jgi:uncharacterized protein
LNLKTTESQPSPGLLQLQPISRRRFLSTGLCGGAGLAIYSGEIERHWIEVKPLEIHLRSLPAVFDGMRIAQLSDIHLDEFTEPFLLLQASGSARRILTGNP